MADELVLIVDDNEKNMRLARDVLLFGGFRTLEATTQPRDIARAAHRPADVILMDIRLPDMERHRGDDACSSRTRRPRGSRSSRSRRSR